MKIGIAICTHNRNERAQHTLDQVKKLSDKNSVIVVVDDCSDIPFPNATFRFNTNFGIATAKNKCIELLYDAGCTHLFLLDDDTRPIKSGWEMQYINTGINHLCMTFDKHSDGTPTSIELLKTKYGLREFNHACGCMLYLTREVVDKVGGMDTDYGRWGYEHISYSMRIHNNYLTPRPFMDIENSQEWLYSEDWDKKAIRTVDNKERLNLFLINKKKYLSEITSDAYIDFKEPIKVKHGNVIITSYFNYAIDPQRNSAWKSDLTELMPLIDYCIANKHKLIIFTDCLNDTINSEFVTFNSVEPNKNHSPNIYRWLVYYDWIKRNTFDKAWFIDATDVMPLKNPFNIVKEDTLYCGDECDMLTENQWMKRNQEFYLRIPDYRSIIASSANETLLNCGVVGGTYKVMSNVLSKWHAISSQTKLGLRICTDMAVFNYIARKYYAGSIIHGSKINTKFKYDEQNNKIAIWKHK